MTNSRLRRQILVRKADKIRQINCDSEVLKKANSTIMQKTAQLLLFDKMFNSHCLILFKRKLFYELNSARCATVSKLILSHL